MSEMQNTPSMVEKFPDAINCGYNQKVTFFLIVHDTSAIYRYIRNGANIQLEFNANGVYKSLSHSGYPRHVNGCLGQSIQQLYASGRAFNFVNDPQQIHKVQKLEEEIEKQKQETKKIRKENNFLKKQLEKVLEKIDGLEQIGAVLT